MIIFDKRKKVSSFIRSTSDNFYDNVFRSNITRLPRRFLGLSLSTFPSLLLQLGNLSNIMFPFLLLNLSPSRYYFLSLCLCFLNILFKMIIPTDCCHFFLLNFPYIFSFLLKIQKLLFPLFNIRWISSQSSERDLSTSGERGRTLNYRGC